VLRAEHLPGHSSLDTRQGGKCPAEFDVSGAFSHLLITLS
jgi:hypothetical protein